MVRFRFLAALALTSALSSLPVRAQFSISRVADAANNASTEGAVQDLEPGPINTGLNAFTGSVVEGLQTRAAILRGTTVLVRGAGINLSPGDTAPGLGTTFSGFRTPFVSMAGSIAFAATTETGSGLSLWAGPVSNLQLVATDGTPAPGTTGNFLIGTSGNTQGELTAYNDAGLVALSAAIQGAPNGSARGLWMGAPGALQLVAREGEQAPGFADGVTWTALRDQLLNEAGQVAFVGNVSLLPPQQTGVTTPEVIVVGEPGALQVVARSGDRAPQTEANVYLALSDKLGLNAVGEVAFRTRLVSTGAVSDSTNAIYAGSANALKLVAREDFTAPGAEADAVFTGFDHPVINRYGEVAFCASLASATRSTGRGIWTGQAGGLRLVARTGDSAPDTGGLVFSNIRQDAVLLSDSGQVAFIADFGSNANSTSGTAVFATDKAGTLRLIAKEGTNVAGGPLINGLQFVTTLASNGDGRRCAFDANGQLLFYANTNATQNSSPQETLYEVTFDSVLPTIPTTGQPKDVAGKIGGTASFSVAALGSRPVTYQWKKDDQILDGETGPTLTLTDLVEADRGAYTVVITRGPSSITSAPAQLTFPPAITTQPVSKSVNAGSTATLKVVATGPGTLSYLWQYKAVNGSSFSDLNSATQATLSLANVAANQAGIYRVVVTNADGSTTSAEVKLTVAAAGDALVTRVLVPGDVPTGISDRQTFSQGEDAMLNNAGEIAFEGGLTGLDSSGAYVRQLDGTYRFFAYRGFNLNLSDGGDLVATVNGTGYLTGQPDAVSVLARRGDVAPGSIYTYSIEAGAALADDGTTAFYYALSNGAGNFIGKPGNVTALALTGQQAPGLATGVLFSGLADPVINPGGTAAFFAQLTGTGITSANDTGLWTGTASGVQRVVAEGDDIPAAGAGVKLGDLVFPSSGEPPCGWNAAGQIAFKASLTGTGVTSDNDIAIFAGTPDALSLVVREGTTNGHLFDLSQKAFPLINSAGQVVFFARVTPTGQSTPLDSIWLWTPGAGAGTLQLIVREGQQVPGMPTGVTFDSADIGRPLFKYSLNGSGQIVFSSFIAGSGISFDTGNDKAIFLTKPNGEVKLVMRAGNDIDLGAGELRGTKDPSLLVYSGGEDGRPRSIGEDGQIVFTTGLTKPASFAVDSGIFTARLPGTEPTAPEVLTQSATAVSETGATLRATVNPNRGVTTVYFEYGTSTSYGQVTSSQVITGGTSPVSITAAITGLSAGETYQYRAVATNSAGTTEGSNVSFTATVGGGGDTTPVATTSLPTNLTDTTATLNGAIDRKGESASYYFEYGTTTSYGQRTPTRITFPGSSAYPVSEEITGLTAKTGYQFRLVVSSIGGSAQSANRSFTTRGPLGDFTVTITDLANGTLISPNSRLLAGAAVKIPRGSKTKIAAVEFFIDGVSVNTDDRSAYKVDATNLDPGQHTLTALGRDTNGKEVESAPVTFTVTDTGAGPLALTSSLTPNAATAAPGDLLTYTLTARNCSNTAVKNVELTLLVPVGSGYIDTLFVNAAGAPVRPPAGSTIAFNGANGTVTVKLKGVSAFVTVTLQLLARVPFDQTATGNVIAGNAFSIKATQVKDTFTASFPSQSISVAGTLASGAARPVLGIFVSQSAAGELPADPSTVTVTKADRRLGVPGAKPARTSNQIVYRLHFANYGDAPAHSVRLVAPVPPGTTYKPKSAVVIAAKGDPIPVSAPAQFGNLLFFDVPSLEAGYFDGSLGSAKTLVYTVNVNADLEIGADIAHEGAAVTSGELLTPVTTNVRKLARVVAPEQMTYSFTRQIVKAANQAVDSAEGTVYHTIFYANQGGLPAKEVGIRYTLPGGLSFQSASFVDHRGKPIATLRTQSITAPSAGATSGDAVFSIGTVGAGKRGAVQVVLKLDPASRPVQSRKTESLYVGYDSTTVQPPSMITQAPRAAKTRAATVPGSQPNQSGVIPQQAYDPTLSRLFILQSAPAAVSALSEFDVVLTWGNLSSTTSGAGSMKFPIPEGTELVSASDSIASFGNQTIGASVNGPSVDFPNGIAVWTLGPVGNSVLAATVRLRVKPGVTGSIVLNEASAAFDQSIGPVICAPLRIRVVPAGLPIASYRTEVYRSSVGQGSDISVGTAASPNAKFVQSVEAIGDGSRAISIAGADYAHIAESGGVVIPLGNGRMVAAGGGNFVNQSTASMVAAGGGNLVAAGGGNLQVAGPGSSFITGTQLISTAPSLVAAGGLNLVAAGGLNLLRKVSGLIGNDGSTLIGMDGSTLIGLDGSTLGAFSQRVGAAAAFTPAAGSAFLLNGGIGGLVAAGGGNIVAAGGGHLVAAGGGNVFPPKTLVGNDGASVIARDGASLIGDYSAGLIGNDGSTLIGNDGSTLVAAGGGNFVSGTTGLVAAGGLNNQ